MPPITDENIAWVRKVKRYTPWELGCVGIVDIDEGETVDYTITGLRSFTESAASAPSSYIVEMQDAANASLGYGALRVATSDTTRWGFVLPYDMDPTFGMGLRLLTSNDTAGTIAAVTTYAIDHPGVVHAVAAGVTTAFSKAIASLVTTVASSYNWTSRGVLNLGLTRAQIEAGPVFRGLITWTITTATEVNLVALEIDYVPHKCFGGPVGADRLLSTS